MKTEFTKKFPKSFHDMKSKFRWCRNFVLHVREEFERVKAGGSEYWTWRSSRKQVLSGQNRVPDTQEAYQYYLATYRYTEDLRSHSATGAGGHTTNLSHFCSD